MTSQELLRRAEERRNQRRVNIPDLNAIAAEADADAKLAEYENVFGRLAAWCDHKRQAIKMRVAGDNECALSYEESCERHYQELPDWARW